MNVQTVLVVVAASIIVSLVICLVMCKVALRYTLLDLPNARSLHRVPVPRLGGVGIVAGAWLVTTITAIEAGWNSRDLAAWQVLGIAIAAVGLVDDLKPLSSVVRLIGQVLVASALVLCVGPPTRILLTATTSVVLPGAVGATLSIIFVVAVLNIYNFMDGMDGLAGSQAVFAGGLFAISFATQGSPDLALIGLAVAAASGGFLLHNLPPARIFMGDAGSTFLGFTMATLSLTGAIRPKGVPLLASFVLLAPFLMDGTFTILRRATRGEPVWKAHRSHLYQRAVATRLTHAQVLTRYVAWMVVCAGTSHALMSASFKYALALALLPILGLIGVWRWVRRREIGTLPPLR